MRAALEVVVVPIPSVVALRGRLVISRVVRNAAALSRVPVPARWRALSAAGRGRRVGLAATRETALLPTEAGEIRTMRFFREHVRKNALEFRALAVTASAGGLGWCTSRGGGLGGCG